MGAVRSGLALAAVTAMLATGLGVAMLRSRPAAADGGPGHQPWVVSLGDSYLSGEGGRWAGNGDGAATDALGPGAYHDATPPATGETVRGCHRASSAPIHLGPTVGSTNLACSGARRATRTDADGQFKPGVDVGTAAAPGQIRQLEELARDPARRITMIALDLGGNDLGVVDIGIACGANYVATLVPLLAGLLPGGSGPCRARPDVTARLTPEALAARTAEIRGAIDDVAGAMGRAGYRDGDYTIEVLTYPAPLAPGGRNRYREDSSRIGGGCGLSDADATWATTSVLGALNDAVRSAAGQAGRTNVKVLDVSHALDGHRLCEIGTARVAAGGDGDGTAAWRRPGAVATAEWVNDVQLTRPDLQESFHPNYWGQLALRACLRLAYNGGAPRGGVCTPTGVGTDGLPAMALA